MSQVRKPILLDETGKEIAGLLRQQNAYLGAMARGSVNALASSWKDIRNIVREGLAPEIFNIGDQFIVPWTDVADGKTYEVPLDIVHFGDATLKDGSVVHAMYLQWHYCTPFDVQFDQAENEMAAETSFLSDCYYYIEDNTANASNKYKLLVAGSDYAVGASIPVSRVYYHSAIKDPTGNIVLYGYNRWSHSSLRQFLNSTKGVNEWWTAQHFGDVAPVELTKKAGFLSGFDEEFLSCLNPIKVTTALNSATDSDFGTTEDTFDTFFLPSLEQVYAEPQLAGVEGEPFAYWKQAVATQKPNGRNDENLNPAYITFDINAKTSAQKVRLRSAARGLSVNTWYIKTNGAIYHGSANNLIRITPVCAIC